jgi:hypothetical protein
VSKINEKDELMYDISMKLMVEKNTLGSSDYSNINEKMLLQKKFLIDALMNHVFGILSNDKVLF